MYHLDPSINVAVERQVERVRAVRAYSQAPRPELSERAWLNENEVKPLRLPHLRRWWPEAIGFGIVILSALAVASEALAAF